MKHILGGEVFWNWTLVDMANEGERDKKRYSQMSALPITKRRNSEESAVSEQAELHKHSLGK